MESAWDPEACAAIEALRSGVVNPFVVKDVTYGRDEEIEALEGTVNGSPGGSCQIVVGRYGVGKSHLCEVLEERLIQAGYAVAKVELGAAHGRAENPDAVLATIRRNIKLSYNGYDYQGDSNLAFLAYSAQEPVLKAEPVFDLRRRIYDRYPDDDEQRLRFEVLRESCLAPSPDLFRHPWEPMLIRPVPTFMTAANLAVAALVRAVYFLRQKLRTKGLVLLLDEAERSEEAANSYRLDRAVDLMRGIALTSSNLPASHLKHYRDEKAFSYCPHSPSLLHSVFWFTRAYGMAYRLQDDTGVRPMKLTSFDDDALGRIAEQITALYGRAYGMRIRLAKDLKIHLPTIAKGGDTRSVVRFVVAALDHARLGGDGRR